MNKQEKIDFVADLGDKLQKATSVILIDYSGMSVKLQQELKKRLKEVSSSMLVAKNTLLKLAGKNAGVSEKAFADSVLAGQTALVLAENDPISPVQVLGKFIKEFELPRFKVAVIEGSFYATESLTKIGSLPTKEVLSGQFIWAIVAPIYGLVGTLKGNISKLLYILEQKTKKIDS